jgi:hypothetical protein
MLSFATHRVLNERVIIDRFHDYLIRKVHVRMSRAYRTTVEISARRKMERKEGKREKSLPGPSIVYAIRCITISGMSRRKSRLNVAGGNGTATPIIASLTNEN